MIFDEELTQLVNTEIAVVDMDGHAYRGRLVKFDDSALVLTEVHETANQDIEWIDEGGGHVKGFMAWRRVLLPRVIIRTPHILRVWPWQLPEDKQHSHERPTHREGGAKKVKKALKE